MAEDIQSRLRLSCTYTPQQNSIVERMWGYAFGTCRVLLASARLAPKFHPWALQTALWIHNRLPSPAYGNRSPFQILARKPADVKYLRAFGCLVKAYIPPATRQGDHHFADTGARGVYLGPSEQSSGSVVYLPTGPNRGKIVVSRHLVFYENEFPGVDGAYPWPTEELAAEEGGSQSNALVPLDMDRDDPPPPATIAAGEQGQDVETTVATTTNDPLPTDVAPPTTTTTMPLVRLPFVPPDADADQLHPEHNTLDHPEANDPSSRHFNRVLPTRRSRNPHPTYGGNDSSRRRARLSSYTDPTRATRPQAVYNFARNALACALATSFIALPRFVYESPFGDADFNVNSTHTAHVVVSTTSLGDVPIPGNYREAMICAHHRYWRAAINKEIAGLLSSRTWDVIRLDQLPAGCNLMNCHFVFDLKRHADGSIEKFKARLVADGNTQRYGVDFDRVFSTVVKMSTVRLALAIAAANDYELSSVDINQAYLQGNLEEPLYMRMPPGLPRQDKGGHKLIAKLRRSLYGLKQAGRIWFDLLKGVLMEWGFVQSKIDVCLYTYTKREDLLWLLIWVDDIICLTNNTAVRTRFVADIERRFALTDKGELSWVLGVKIERNRAARNLTMSQELYTRDLVARFVEPKVSRKYDSPMDDSAELSHLDCPSPGSPQAEAMASKREKYMTMVGAILWLANVTRPELSYAASQLARFVSNPGEVHYSAAMRVMVYLSCTPERVLTFKPKLGPSLVVLADSDWSASFSTSGALFFFMGALVHWFSKTQKSVSLSTAQAEYFGAMLAAKDIIWLRELLFDLGYPQKGPTRTRLDSKSAIDMAFDPIAFKKTKHIMRAAEFLRDLVARAKVNLDHIEGPLNVADILTKAQSRSVFLQLIKLLHEPESVLR